MGLPPACTDTRTVSRPRATCRLARSRICASRISSSRGRFTVISLCLRLTELNSTVTLKPSREQSPRPYPVIDFIAQNSARPAKECRISNCGAAAQASADTRTRTCASQTQTFRRQGPGIERVSAAPQHLRYVGKSQRRGFLASPQHPRRTLTLHLRFPVHLHALLRPLHYP